MTRRVLAPCISLAAVLTISLAACGGGSTEPAQPSEKTCVQDPAQLKCQVAALDTGLRLYADKRSRNIGTAIDALFGNATFNTVLNREFNYFTPGNALKFGPSHPTRSTWTFTTGDAMLAYAQANGMKMRGHTLVWHQQNPTWLTSTTYPADTLAKILNEHIAAMVGHFKGKLVAWDVVNEVLADDGKLRSTFWSQALGRNFIYTAFTAARTADPAAQLFYNDYNLEFPGAKQDSAYALIQDLKTRGIPIDGIGFQAHFQINTDGSGVPSKQSLKDTFAKFASLGIKVNVTELDVRIRVPGATTVELNAQVQAYSDVVSACMETPACESLVIWGFTDAESWIPGTFPGYGDALLFDATYAKKATYNAVKAAVR